MAGKRYNTGNTSFPFVLFKREVIGTPRNLSCQVIAETGHSDGGCQALIIPGSPYFRHAQSTSPVYD
jgi:hypothetical protein